MADSVKSPGIEISQVITETPVTPVAPTLASCVVGPCYEVMEAVVDGLPNISSKISGLSYSQFPLKVSSGDFPTNNTTTNELVFDPDSMDATLVRTSGVGTTLIPLEEGIPGSAFLSTLNIATRPALAFCLNRINIGGGFGAGKLYLRANSEGASAEITLAGTENNAQMVQKFIDAGFECMLHTVVADDVFATSLGQAAAVGPIIVNDFAFPGNILLIVTLPNVSSSYGTNAALTLQRLQSVGDANHAQWVEDTDGDGATYDVRIEGSGFYVGSDNATLVLSKGQFYSGSFIDTQSYEDDNQGIDWTGNEAGPDTVKVKGLLLDEDAWDNFTSENTYAHKQLTGGHNLLTDYDIKGATSSNDGDNIYLDGTLVGQASKVTSASMKIVSVDTTSSRYTDDGSIIFQRYIDVSLRGLRARYAYVRANNLGSTAAEYAEKELDLTGTDSFTAATQATLNLYNVELGAGDPALLLKDTQLIIRVNEDGAIGQNQIVAFDQNYDGAAGQAALAAKLGSELEGITVEASDTTVTIKSKSYGSSTSITLVSSLEGSTANLAFREGVLATDDYLTPAYTATVNGADATIDTLSSKTINLYYDYNPKAVILATSTDSVSDFVQLINDAVFFPSASFDASTNVLKIRGGLKGRPGYISIQSTGIVQLATTLSNKGSGRPLPELAIGAGGAHIDITGQILRSSLTGYPLPWDNLNVSVHVSYKALRLDVTPSPTNGDAGLIKISSLAQLVGAFSPLTPDNPLGLAMYYALINTDLDGTEVSAIGISDVSSAEPDGTLMSYRQALDLISAHEVYSIVPLTSNEEVLAAFDDHVTTLSSPSNRAERILLAAPSIPSREESTLVVSGTAAQSTGTMNVIQLDEAHADELSAHVDAMANPIPFSDDAYITININGTVHNYSVQALSGSNVVIRTVVPYIDNLDGFFSVEPLLPNVNFEGAEYTLAIRGNTLTVPGTSLIDAGRLARTIRNTSSQYRNRRHVRIFPDQVSSVIDGIDTVIPAYYYAAGLAGDASSRPAQDPLTRNSLNGFSGVIGPRLSNINLDIVAAGNFILHVEREGEIPVVRMQCTTDADSLENRELSIVKAIDTFAKTLRSVLRDSIGRFNITQDYLDSIGILVGGVCTNAVAEGLLASAEAVNIKQDAEQRDTLIVDVAIAVLYPANYIKLTIVV
jgi:hypothetical protein